MLAPIIASNTRAGRHPRDPHHGGGRIAHHAPGAACIGRRHDRGEESDMHFAAEKLVGDGATDERAGDVVEKAGKNPHYHLQQQETAFPVMRVEIAGATPAHGSFRNDAITGRSR